MNIENILNTVRDNASATYRERIPEATRDNMEDIRAIMINEDNVMVANEFMQTLLNKLVKSYVHTKLFSNPLKSLKKGHKPLGDTVEEIYNNFVKGQEYDGQGNSTLLLGRNLPDTKTVYHRMNYKMKYPVTVSREQLSKAFSSYDALESYISNIINQLHNSAELDEFINTKQLIASALDQNALVEVPIADPLLSKENSETFIEAVKTVSGLMAYPSTDWNNYLKAQSYDTKPITTFTRKEEQVLILDTATDTKVSVSVLANTFNMSVAEFNDTKKIVIDTFPDKNIRAALVDEAFFQIYDDVMTVASFFNGESLYTNYWLHVWQTLAYSILVNGVVFTVAKDTDTDNDIKSYKVTKSVVEGAKLSNRRVTVFEGASYSSTVSGTFTSVDVKMGGSAVSGAYDSATKTITIDNVTGDITITVA